MLDTKILNYSILNDHFYQFDADLGYTMKPGVKMSYAWVSEGLPVQCREYQVNSIGNMDRVKPNFNESDLKILVFGDSQTWMQLQGLTWPDVLHDKLQNDPGRRVSVMNFARNGYGIVQMFDLAAHIVPQWKPDIVIFAFISDDVTRDRLYFAGLTVNGEPRLMLSKKATAEPHLSWAFDHAVLDPAFNIKWAESIIKSRDRNDPFLIKSNRKFLQFRDEFLLANGNDIKAERLIDLPRLTINSYLDDLRFRNNLETVKAVTEKLVFLHLPRYEELSEGGIQLSVQGKMLLSSLQEYTRSEILSLGGLYNQYRDVVPNPYDLFMLPYDAHPNLKGFEFYAWGALQALAQLQLV